MLRVAARIAVSRALSSVSRQTILAPLKVNAPAVPVRFFSPTPTAIQEVADRVFYILSLFDKIDQEKLSLDCRFDKDLGLDSLDTTEIAMAVEDEFHLEIPVETMDLLLTPRELIDHLCDNFDINH